MEFNIAGLRLIVGVPFVRHGVIWVKNDCVYRVFLFSFLRDWLLGDYLFWNECTTPLKISLRSFLLRAEERGHAVLNRLLKVLFQRTLISRRLRSLLGRIKRDSMIGLEAEAALLSRLGRLWRLRDLIVKLDRLHLLGHHFHLAHFFAF